MLSRWIDHEFKSCKSHTLVLASTLYMHMYVHGYLFTLTFLYIRMLRQFGSSVRNSRSFVSFYPLYGVTVEQTMCKSPGHTLSVVSYPDPNVRNDPQLWESGSGYVTKYGHPVVGRSPTIRNGLPTANQFYLSSISVIRDDS